MPHTYADLFDDKGSSNTSSTWSPINTSAPTQIAQSIQYQFEEWVDEKDFFLSRYDKEYGWLRLSNGRYIIRQKNTRWTNDLILHDGTQEICRIKNITITVSANWNKEVINGKTWLHITKNNKTDSTTDIDTLVNRICVDNLEQYTSEDYRFKNVTGMVHVCKKDPSHENAEIAYFLTDHWFPKSFFEHFLDLWEGFHNLLEDWLPKFETKNILELFIESGEYKDQYFVVRIENGSPEYIPGKIISTENISSLHDSLVVIENNGIKNLYSMRLWKDPIYTNIDRIETEVLSWEQLSIAVKIILPNDTYITKTLWKTDSWSYGLINT